MANRVLIGIIVVLVILVVISAVAVLWLRRDLIECEQTESPYCPQFTCATQDGPGNGKGTAARRQLPDSACAAQGISPPCYQYSS